MQTYKVRGRQVVIDRDLANEFGIETKYLKRVVKRNLNLLNGEDFVFEMTKEECLRCQIVTLNASQGNHLKYLPFAFTKEGVQVLKSLLKSGMDIEFPEEPPLPAVYEESWNEGTVVLYSAENLSESLEVKVTEDNVWLNRNQIAILFGRDIKTISKHINNAMIEELQNTPTVANFATVQTEGGRDVLRYIEYYNLDMVLSVGYRVKSPNGVAFRRWANKVIKDKILHQNYLEKRVERLEIRVSKTEENMEMMINRSLPPVEQIFMQGQFFDAYKLFSDLIRSAKERVIIIDNYVDESVLELLRKRNAGVIGVIYTSERCYSNNNFKLDLQKYNAQYPHIDVYPMSKVHDRFMIIDDVLYSSGGSFKDAGKKLFSFEKMTLSPDVILQLVSN